MENEIGLIVGAFISVLVTSVATGWVTAVRTVSALQIHYDYIRRDVDELKINTKKAHQRIDGLHEDEGT